jgi:hypothetical protein
MLVKQLLMVFVDTNITKAVEVLGNTALFEVAMSRAASDPFQGSPRLAAVGKAASQVTKLAPPELPVDRYEARLWHIILVS